MFPLIPLAAGALLGGLVARRSARAPSLSSPATIGTSGGLQRLQVSVPMAYVDAVRAQYGREGQRELLADIARRAQRLGFEPTQSPMQDPTNNEIVKIIGRPSGTQIRAGDGVIQVIGVEPIAVERSLPRLPTASIGAAVSPFDPGLKQDEIDTVRHALLTETDPRHLRGLASTFVPWFPVSASLLYARANAIDVHTPSPTGGVDHPALGSMSERVQRLALLRRQRDLPRDLLDDEVRRTACLLAEDPNADLQYVPPAVVHLARALVKVTSEGARYVDGQLARSVCPPTGREGFVSPAALDLVHAYAKPNVSGVVSPQEVRRRRQELAANVRAEGALPGTSRTQRHDLMYAKAAMEKAEKTLDRQRWMRWYEAHEA